MTAPSPRFFLVVDDDALALRALRRTIAPFGEVVPAESFSEGKRLIEDGARRWTGMLVDKRLPDGSGLELLSLARQRYPVVPILLITGHADHEATNTAFRLDVKVMAKPLVPDLVRRFCAEASSHLTTEEFDLRIAQVVHARAEARGLSPAETDIFLRASLCQTIEEIADARGASAETVRKQTASLRSKLGCQSLHEAVLQVLREACRS